PGGRPAAREATQDDRQKTQWSDLLAGCSRRKKHLPSSIAWYQCGLAERLRPHGGFSGMPAPQFHLTFGELVARHPDIRPAMRAAVDAEPVYTHLGSIFHDLPYYGNMIAEAIR